MSLVVLNINIVTDINVIKPDINVQCNKIAKLNNCYIDVTLHFGFVSKSRDYVIA